MQKLLRVWGNKHLSGLERIAPNMERGGGGDGEGKGEEEGEREQPHGLLEHVERHKLYIKKGAELERWRSCRRPKFNPQHPLWPDPRPLASEGPGLHVHISIHRPHTYA